MEETPKVRQEQVTLIFRCDGRQRLHGHFESKCVSVRVEKEVWSNDRNALYTIYRGLSTSYANTWKVRYTILRVHVLYSTRVPVTIVPY